MPRLVFLFLSLSLRVDSEDVVDPMGSEDIVVAVVGTIGAAIAKDWLLETDSLKKAYVSSVEAGDE